MTATLSIPEDTRGVLLDQLRTANAELRAIYPGERTARQPVHTVYGGAQLFKATTVSRMGDLALRSLHAYAPTPDVLGTVLGWNDPAFADRLHARIVDKLERESVEDFRIDFEDGYGNRPDAEEDGHAASVAGEVARGMAEGSLPPFIGIRIKPLTDELAARSLRTLDIFISTLLSASGGALPDHFVVTLPKVTHVAHVQALVQALARIETAYDLTAGTLKLEIMVETPQSIFAPDGTVHLPRLVDAAEGRCIGAHFGTYDYTALVNITAEYQDMMHASCDYARSAMQVSLAQRGLMLSDGATNILPVAPHRGEGLTPEQLAENNASVHRAWKIAYDHTRHSLVNGFYQGWDLHPAQLPIRYAAIYSFFLESLAAATLRLKSFMETAAQATLVGDVFDDAATGQGLLNYFLRGLACGAISEDEALATGLTLDEFRSRSFAAIVAGRRT